jgi:hypothetical protein
MDGITTVFRMAACDCACSHGKVPIRSTANDLPQDEPNVGRSSVSVSFVILANWKFVPPILTPRFADRQYHTYSDVIPLK